MRKFCVILLFVFVCFCLTSCSDNKKSDSLKFKLEYESINNLKNDNNKKYREVNISSDNPFVYATASSIVEKINNNETFIVFFAFKECPWCRSVVEELIRAAKDSDVSTIYYVDVKDIRDIKKVDNGQVVDVKSGSPAYMQLIDNFDNVLDDYTLDGVSVSEKRIYAPNLIAVSNGKAIKLETGISDELKDPYQDLTDSIKSFSYNKFKCLMKCLEEESTTCKKNSC